MKAEEERKAREKEMVEAKVREYSTVEEETSLPTAEEEESPTLTTGAPPPSSEKGKKNIEEDPKPPIRFVCSKCFNLFRTLTLMLNHECPGVITKNGKHIEEKTEEAEVKVREFMKKNGVV